MITTQLFLLSLYKRFSLQLRMEVRTGNMHLTPLKLGLRTKHF